MQRWGGGSRCVGGGGGGGGAGGASAAALLLSLFPSIEFFDARRRNTKRQITRRRGPALSAKTNFLAVACSLLVRSRQAQQRASVLAGLTTGSDHHKQGRAACMLVFSESPAYMYVRRTKVLLLLSQGRKQIKEAPGKQCPPPFSQPDKGLSVSSAPSAYR